MSPEQNGSGPGIHDKARQIFGEATTEIVERQKIQAAAVAQQVPVAVKRQRFSKRGLIVGLLVLAAILVVEFGGAAIAEWLDKPPTEAAAKQQADNALAAIVADIESFRTDYGEVPETLAEVGTPSKGRWVYHAIDKQRFRVEGTLYGNAVRFESSQAAERPR